MRWFWVVYWDSTVPNPYVSGRDELRGFSVDRFYVGEPLENWTEEAWIAPDSPEGDGEPDDFLQNHLDLPIFSPRLRLAVEQGGIKGIQFCPVRVLHFDRRPFATFSIANILNAVPALDLDKSDYDAFPSDYFAAEDRGRVSGVRIPVLKAKQLEDLDIIRAREFMAAIYVSDFFRKLFVGARFTGCSFREVVVV